MADPQEVLLDATTRHFTKQIPPWYDNTLPCVRNGPTLIAAAKHTVTICSAFAGKHSRRRRLMLFLMIGLTYISPKKITRGYSHLKLHKMSWGHSVAATGWGVNGRFVGLSGYIDLLDSNDTTYFPSKMQ